MISDAGMGVPAELGGAPSAVLIPVKSLVDAKLRLSGALDPAARMGFARSMAQHVVASAGPVPTFVVCDNDEIATWARDVGATVLWRPDRGLNGAVNDAMAALGEAEIARVVVAHADLPFARDLHSFADFAGVTLVPDRHGDGTNVCSVNPASDFAFAYGAGSFRRHLAEAQRCGLAVRVIHSRRLGWDVDRPDDLNVPADLEAELAQHLPERP